jgi:acetyl/propionyl-CoA carboxylase alpha subunit
MPGRAIKKILVANRSEIAIRAMRAAAGPGIGTLSNYDQAPSQVAQCANFVASDDARNGPAFYTFFIAIAIQRTSPCNSHLPFPP